MNLLLVVINLSNLLVRGALVFNLTFCRTKLSLLCYLKSLPIFEALKLRLDELGQLAVKFSLAIIQEVFLLQLFEVQLLFFFVTFLAPLVEDGRILSLALGFGAHLAFRVVIRVTEQLRRLVRLLEKERIEVLVGVGLAHELLPVDFFHHVADHMDVEIFLRFELKELLPL